MTELEVTHCPMCGERGNPLFAFAGENKIKVQFECGRHGEFEISINAQTEVGE